MTTFRDGLSPDHTLVDTAEQLDVQTRWARLLVASLADSGVTDVVISPGSRSTPLVLAAHHEPRLRCWDIMDERSASFFALAHGAIRARPSVLLCTSGTAGAHYLPAVIEASMSHIPLLIVTADRPVELVDCGANQTIDQMRLFGHHARQFFDLGRADSSPRALRALRRAAAQAVVGACSPRPGAVHMNVRLSKPLEPMASTELEQSPTRRSACADRSTPRVFVAPAAPSEASISALVDALCRARRPLIVAGPGPVSRSGARSSVADLAARLGAPLLVETTSQWRFRSGRDHRNVTHIAHFDALLRSDAFGAAHVPDLILQLGRAPTSGAWTRWLGRLTEREPAVAHCVVSPHDWPDPESTATVLVRAEVEPTMTALAACLDGDEVADDGSIGEAGWLPSWRAADRLVDAARKAALAWTDDAGEATKRAVPLTEGRVAATVIASLEPGSLLALGNSLAVRQVDTWSPGPGDDVLVWHQRGASGIDGLISGAVGAAVAADRPTTLLLGDVSFLHDLGGLAVARDLVVPVVVVVVDNGGGRIFEQLPIAKHPQADDAMHHWTTPHEADMASAAAIFGHSFARCTDLDALRIALRDGHARIGCSVIQAVVPPHGAATENAALWRSVSDVVEAGS